MAPCWLGCGSEPSGPDAASSSAAPSSPEFVSHASPDSQASRSVDAQPELAELLRRDFERTPHPADGGGRVYLASPTAPPGELAEVRVGGHYRFRMIYEAGSEGIALGGVLFFQGSPFWGWDLPQIGDPDAPGYTTVESGSPELELTVEMWEFDLVAIRIGGRAMRAGERIEVIYGAGEARARVDRFAERETRIWFAVDGDGDGERSPVASSPAVNVVPRTPRMVHAVLPSTARPGEGVRLTLAALDAAGNTGAPTPIEFRLEVPEGLELPDLVTLRPEDAGRKTIEGKAIAEGVYRVKVFASRSGDVNLEMVLSNPLVVRSDLPRVLWADLHGHSNLSDGTGTPEDYFRYARDVAGLDAAALTDHDHWGVAALYASPRAWQRSLQAAERFNEPGRFVALTGFEWTNWMHGHRHVLYFDTGLGSTRAHEALQAPAGVEGAALAAAADPTAPMVYSASDPAYDTPAKLWDALRGQAALTFAHHTAGGPISTNWDYAPDPVLEPVTEIVSTHGSSEAADAPFALPDATGSFVRDVLGRGYRLGFIGSGDSHDGHPGLVQLATPKGRRGGLAAILSDRHDRGGILEALRRRRSYATNGVRIWLDMTLDGAPMGSVLDGVAQGPHELVFEIAAPGEIERVDLIRGGAPPVSIPGEGRLDWTHRRPLPRLAPDEFFYLRVVLVDGGAAWSSPIWGPSGEPSGEPIARSVGEPTEQAAGQTIPVASSEGPG